MDVFVGWFKRAFVQSTGRLIAQLSSGATFFNYNNVDTDNTEHASENNLTGHGDNINSGQNATVKTTVWIEPVTKRVVSTGFFHNTQTPASPVSGPALEINIEEESPFVLVGKKYVAKLIPYYTFNGLSYSRNLSDICGGTHIQNILGVDYIVAYNLTFLSGGGFRLQKLMGVLDLEIDQSLIEVLPIVDTIDHVDPDLQRPYQIPGYDGTPEYGVNLPRNNRILCCNEDGTKTVFFVKRNNGAGDYNIFFPIFELTDDGVTFSVTQVGEFDATQVIDGTLVDTTDFTTDEDTFIGHTCGDCGPQFNNANYVQDDPRDYSPYIDQLPLGWDHGLSYSETQTIERSMTRNKTFLGVAYDRSTDEIIYAHSEFTLDGYKYDLTIAYTAGGSWSYDFNSINNGDGFRLYVNDTELIAESDNHYTVNGNLSLVSGDIYNSSGTEYQKILNNGDIQIGVIDLSCKAFVTYAPYNIDDGLNAQPTQTGGSIQIDVDRYTQGDLNVYVGGVLKSTVVNKSAITQGFNAHGVIGRGGQFYCITPPPTEEDDALCGRSFV